MNELLDIEQRVRRTCHAIAERTVVGTEADVHALPTVRTAGAGRARPPARLAAAVAVVAAVAVGVAVVVVESRPDGTDPVVTGPASPGSTEPLPDAPIVGRADHSAVWTGTEMVVFGGDDERTPGWGADGAAAYDAEQRSWRRLADPPADLDLGSNAVWTGTEVVAFGIDVGNHRVDEGTTLGAVYDLGQDRWRPISNPHLGSPGRAFWIGDEVLVTGFSASGNTRADAVGVASYDPRTDRWHDLPDAPVNLSSPVWTGHELIFVGDDVEPQAAGEAPPAPRGTIAVALDPTTERWRTLPAPPLERREDQLTVWTGTRLVVAGGGRPADAGAPGGVPSTDAISFDPATETWTPLPASPVSVSGAVGTNAAVVGGQLVALHTGDPDGRSLVLDPVRRTWRFGPPDPLAGRRGATAVSIGDEVLVWGGLVEGSPGALAEGFAYTPPR